MADTVLLDNDVILKLAVCGIAVWDGNYLQCRADLAALGSTRFVLPKLIAKRYKNLSDRGGALSRLSEFLSVLTLLEPDETEIRIASEIEAIAQQEGLFFDIGESLLLTMLVTRALFALVTGDKRAIRSLRKMSAAHGLIEKACGRIVSLEQLIGEIIQLKGYEAIRGGVCRESGCDRALALIFQCSSQSPSVEDAALALDSYIRDIMTDAAEYMFPDVSLFAVAP